MDPRQEKEAQDHSKKLGKGLVKCGYCDMDHWSTSCPHEDKLTLKDEERIEGDTKIVTHWEQQGGKKVEVIQKTKFPESIAKRKAWKKFGKSATDGDGPNLSNTQIQDEIQMDFSRNKETQMNQTSRDQSMKISIGYFKCWYCEKYHWASHWSPDMDILTLTAPTVDTMAASAKDEKLGGPPDESGSRNVPPSKRGRAARRKVKFRTQSKDEANTIRVTNLPEDMQDSDIRALFAPLGRITRIFLARDKYTGASKGFAFVSFDRKEDAAKAVATVNGHGYANLILNVEWANVPQQKRRVVVKPSFYEWDFLINGFMDKRWPKKIQDMIDAEGGHIQ